MMREGKSQIIIRMNLMSNEEKSLGSELNHSFTEKSLYYVSSWLFLISFKIVFYLCLTVMQIFHGVLSHWFSRHLYEENVEIKLGH